MRKQLILALCGICCGISSARGADVTTTQKLIVGTWYCPSSDVPQRFDFDANGQMKWFSYMPLKGTMKFWSLDSSGSYGVTTATRVHPSVMGDLTIRGLSADKLTFASNTDTFSCTRTPPAGDDSVSRAEADAELARQKQAFLGKWVSKTGKEYVEFLSNDACVIGTLTNGAWHKEQNTSDVLHEGKDAQCGGSGIYSKDGPNAISLDYGMGGPPIHFFRKTTPAAQ